ncbi:bifunctional adenosylcobinamide kinase/adenosylcobinamide-phosphate guanylyltransferase, partial [bacterium]|nr:bifunctional adenosylcobinamide kinase/adenosylcobinamide-phosphate guanylyltransferase [bacterium]
MIILITGGIKSGKSDSALSLAEKQCERKNCYFLATAVPSGTELKERIKNHKKKRKKIWKTIEEPEN